MQFKQLMAVTFPAKLFHFNFSFLILTQIQSPISSGLLPKNRNTSYLVCKPQMDIEQKGTWIHYHWHKWIAALVWQALVHHLNLEGSGIYLFCFWASLSCFTIFIAVREEQHISVICLNCLYYRKLIYAFSCKLPDNIFISSWPFPRSTNPTSLCLSPPVDISRFSL